jgi:ATP-dependent helicase Lhr and Lhr-like helicase
MSIASGMATALFHPVVRDWFARRFGEPTAPQARGWPAIAAGRDTLIAAPTGSGKTLAAFLWCLDGLLRRAQAGGLEDRTYVVYVSPLKALSHDIHVNLQAPLEELRAGFSDEFGAIGEVRVAVRTGDTTAADREAHARRPAHVLVTTPESLYILLTSQRGRAGLGAAETVIVDEIHALADDRRGAHLMLSLERLDALRAPGARRAQRIGLSATQRPMELVAAFLTGGGECAIVDEGHARELDVDILSHRGELTAVASHEQWGEVHDTIAALAREHRTTIVFTNTRRLCERMAHALSERLGEGQAAAHHGALARGVRLESERRLREGSLKVMVATASLELGIDVGAVDLVCQIGTPRAIATLLQRIGRAGHARRATPKGRLFAMTRDDLVECAALVRALRQGRLDALCVPERPLDILAQQLVATCVQGDWDEDELYALVRRAHPYRELPRADFDAVLDMLAEGVAGSRGRASAHLHRDRVGRRVRARRSARLAAILSGGAIPDRADYDVVVDPEGVKVGTLDEDFAIESMAGDVFLLGNMSWRIRRVEAGRVRVEDARGQAPTIPFWRGEGPGRTRELSEEVSRLRADVAARLDDPERGGVASPAGGSDTVREGDNDAAGVASPAGGSDTVREGDNDAAAAWVAAECRLDATLARQLVDYLAAARAALGTIPTQSVVVAERFFDEGGGMQLVVHAPFGQRINMAWGLALRKRFCRAFNYELQAAATDDGIVISLLQQHSFPLDTVADYVPSSRAREILTQAALQAPMFETRWRWNATRALAVARRTGRGKVPAQLVRMRTADLLASVFPQAAACQDNVTGALEPPDHPLVNQTLKDCLEEAMDTPGLEDVLARLERGEIRFLTRELPEPSVMSHALLNANPYAYLDDAPLEERRTRAVSVRRGLPADVARDLGALDPQAIVTVRAEAGPPVRDADELHDLLCLVGALAPVPAWQPWFEELARARRATRLAGFWVAAERLPLARAAYGDDAPLDPSIEPAPGARPYRRDEAVAALVRGRLEGTGPETEASLAAHLGLPAADVADACARLEADGSILRGRFDPALGDAQWCERRLLARIHRLTLGRLRREIEPVTPADLSRFLARWQRLAPGTQLHGVPGLAAVLEQLAGFEAAVGAWETEILPARVAGYDPALLDELCLSGEIVWGRRGTSAAGITTRATPIAFWPRAAAPWMAPAPSAAPDSASPAGAVHQLLVARGALFYAEIAERTGLVRAQLDEALWALVASGRVTADGFAALRALGADRTRRTGRWSLLETTPAAPEVAGEKHARQLLARYGVVFRDLCAREEIPPWRDLLVVWRRLEARGEIRGGRFVAGFVGEQFAVPEAIDGLRAARRHARAEEAPVDLAPAPPPPARDPLYIRALFPAAAVAS